MILQAVEALISENDASAPARPRRATAALFVLLAGALAQASCAGWPFVPVRPVTEYSEQELYDDLAQYAAQFSSVVSAAADEIADLTDSRRVRRSTLIWKLRMIPLAQEAAFGDDPRESYVHTLGIALSMHDYLTEGDGRALFGEHQEVAVRAAAEMESAARAIGPRFLDAKQIEELDLQIERLAREHPIRGRDFAIEAARAAATAEIESGTAGLGWVTGVPMSPFRALEGVGTAGTAMLEINRTAAEFAEIVDELPRQNRWQIELLLFDIEERDTVIAGLAAFEQVAASADRASQAIARLPDDLRVALGDSQGALAEANQTLQTAQQLMVPVSATVEEIGRISVLLAEMQGDDDGAPQEPPGRPFDIREYEATAQQVGATVTELRGLLTELDALLETGKLDGTILRTVDGTEEELGQLVGRIRNAAIQVLLLFFALLLAYRLLASRLVRRA